MAARLWPKSIIALLPTACFCEVVVPRGVAPSDAAKYAPERISEKESFRCHDGKQVLMYSALNDNFCDCRDGSDEPGTDACAGAGQGVDRYFYCPNKLSQPRYIYSSMVNDGVCDCCDASDEWLHELGEEQTKRCRNTCDEEGRSWRDASENKRAAFRQSQLKRAELINESKTQVETWATEIAYLQQQHPSLMKAKSARWEEYVHLGGNESHAAGLRADEVRLKEVRIRAGHLVDQIAFHYSDGSSDVLGGNGGIMQQPFVLDEDEYLVKIDGQAGESLDGIRFQTSNGKRSKWFGGKAGARFDFQATEGMQIWSVKRSLSGMCPKVESLVERVIPKFFGEGASQKPKISEYAKWMESENVAPEQVPASAPARAAADEPPIEVARKMFLEANKTLAKTSSRLEMLQRDFSRLEMLAIEDLPDAVRDAHYALLNLADECLSKNVVRYDYQICFNKDAKQDKTLLGKWSGWEGLQAVFKDGDECPGAVKRRLTVKFQCGGAEVGPPKWAEISTIKETQMCVYEAVVSHPAACNPTDSLGEEILPAVSPKDEL